MCLLNIYDRKGAFELFVNVIIPPFGELLNNYKGNVSWQTNIL